MAAQNVVNEIALIRVIGWGEEPMRLIRPYLFLGAGLAVLLAIRLLFHPGFVIAVLVSAVVSLGVLRQTRHDLELLTMFPELNRIRPLRSLLA